MRGAGGALGDFERAASIVRECAAGGLRSIKRSTTWLTCIAAMAETAAAVGDEEVAAEALDLLLPFADLPVLPSFAVACFGSVHRYVGLAAGATGRRDEAVAHLRAAVDGCDRLGNAPARLQARADLAAALVAIDDVPAARHELQEAIGGRRALGLDALADRWASTVLAALWGRGLTFARAEGGGWEVGLGEDRVDLPDLVGCHHLAALVAHPGREVPVLRLVLARDGLGGRQEVMDGRSLADARRRVEDLRRDIDLAERAGDADRAACSGTSSTPSPATWPRRSASAGGCGPSTTSPSGPAPRCRRRSAESSTASRPPIR